MTLARLKRIEMIVTVIITVLLLAFASLVSWFLGDHYSVRVWQQRALGWSYFLHLSYGLLALTLAPLILFIIRKVAKKKAALFTFFATLPSTIALFSIPITYLPLFIILVLTAVASQQTAQQRGLKWPYGIHMALSIMLGAIFSLILALLVRAYVNYRPRSAANEENKSS